MMDDKEQKKQPLVDRKNCGCPEEEECDHHIANLEKYCEYNPGAPECKIFDL